MKTFNFIASCKVFNSGNADKNGLMPLVLVPLAGTSPRGLNVISGTSAELQGYEAGKVYAISAIEQDPYIDEDTGRTVRSFQFNSVGEVNTIEAMEYANKTVLKVIIEPENVEVTKKGAPVEADA
jgi:hypothetical protein